MKMERRYMPEEMLYGRTCMLPLHNTDTRVQPHKSNSSFTHNVHPIVSLSAQTQHTLNRKFLLQPLFLTDSLSAANYFSPSLRKIFKEHKMENYTDNIDTKDFSLVYANYNQLYLTKQGKKTHHFIRGKIFL